MCFKRTTWCGTFGAHLFGLSCMGGLAVVAGPRLGQTISNTINPNQSKPIQSEPNCVGVYMVYAFCVLYICMGPIRLEPYVVYVVWCSRAFPDRRWPKFVHLCCTMADQAKVGVPSPYKVFVGGLFKETHHDVLEMVAMSLGAPKPVGGCYVVTRVTISLLVNLNMSFANVRTLFANMRESFANIGEPFANITKPFVNSWSYFN